MVRKLWQCDLKFFFKEMYVYAIYEPTHSNNNLIKQKNPKQFLDYVVEKKSLVSYSLFLKILNPSNPIRQKKQQFPVLELSHVMKDGFLLAESIIRSTSSV